jgi:sugar phosphate isomerase/epimerase
MDITAFAGMVAEKFGVFNINPLADHFRSTEPAYLDRFRSSLEKARSHIVDFGLGGREFYSADAQTRQEAIEYGRKWIDVAGVIGSPSVRQHIRGKRGVKPDVETAAQTLGKLAEYGSKRNIVINLENDNPVAEDPFFLVNVIEKVNNPYLRGLPDFGNSLPGHDAAYNQRAVGAMLDHAFNMCHVKDIMEADGKHYVVDLPALFQLAKQRRFRGYFSMECEAEAEDPFAGTKRLINVTLQNLS